MTRRSAWRPILVAALYLALLGWSAAVVTSSTNRRSISVVCSSIEDLCRGWADEFTLSTGIEVAMVRLSTGEALARITAPGAVVEYDVWHGGPAESYVLAAASGRLSPYRPVGADTIPTRYRDPGDAWTGTYLGVLGFCSNRAALDRLGVAAPTSWDDLLAPRLRGHIAVPNPVTSGTGYSLVWTQRLRLGDEDAALAWLRHLNRSVLMYTTSGMAPARMVGRGEAAVAVTFSQHCAKAHDEGMSDLVVTYPADGTGFEVGAVAVLAGARDPEAARRYVDFAVSRTAQAAGAASHSSQLPTRPDLPADPRLGGDARLLPYVPADAAATKQTLTDRVQTEVRR